LAKLFYLIHRYHYETFRIFKISKPYCFNIPIITAAEQQVNFGTSILKKLAFQKIDYMSHILQQEPKSYNMIVIL
jgi:hypothetical protein